MRFIGLLVLIVCSGLTFSAHASIAETRSVAMLYGCNPSKIEVIRTKLGTPSQTIYRVQCNMPKATGDNAGKTANALIVSCNGTLCDMLRATKD